MAWYLSPSSSNWLCTAELAAAPEEGVHAAGALDAHRLQPLDLLERDRGDARAVDEQDRRVVGEVDQLLALIAAIGSSGVTSVSPQGRSAAAFSSPGVVNGWEAV